VIRAVVVIAVAWALWRKVGRRRRYALGLLGTAGLSVIGACLGGVIGDLAVGGNSVKGDLVAASGAILGTVVFLYAGELASRRRKGWPLRGQPPPPPPRSLRLPKRRSGGSA
jgi:hypothetical protein